MRRAGFARAYPLHYILDGLFTARQANWASPQPPGHPLLLEGEHEDLSPRAAVVIDNGLCAVLVRALSPVCPWELDETGSCFLLHI